MCTTQTGTHVLLEGTTISLELAGVAQGQRGGTSTSATPRLRTRLFAARCLLDMPTAVGDDPRHHSLIAATAAVKAAGKGDWLVLRLAALVDVGFKISTGQLEAIRPMGLKLLRVRFETNKRKSKEKRKRIQLRCPLVHQPASSVCNESVHAQCSAVTGHSSCKTWQQCTDCALYLPVHSPDNLNRWATSNLQHFATDSPTG